MLFALLCTDKPNSLDLRMQVRPEHLTYLESLGSALKAAGPFTSDEGSPIGSLVIIEAADRAAQSLYWITNRWRVNCQLQMAFCGAWRSSARFARSAA